MTWIRVATGFVFLYVVLVFIFSWLASWGAYLGIKFFSRGRQ